MIGFIFKKRSMTKADSTSHILKKWNWGKYRSHEQIVDKRKQFLQGLLTEVGRWLDILTQSLLAHFAFNTNENHERPLIYSEKVRQTIFIVPTDEKSAVLLHYRLLFKPHKTSHYTTITWTGSLRATIQGANDRINHPSRIIVPASPKCQPILSKLPSCL